MPKVKTIVKKTPKSVKEIDIIVERKRRKTKKVKKRNGRQLVGVGPNKFMSMISCKECFNPSFTSERYLRSLFFPDAGQCRGMAFGSTNTALTDFRYPFELTVTAGNAAVVWVVPELILHTSFLRYGLTTSAILGTTTVDLTNSTLYPTVTNPVAPSVDSTDTTNYRLTSFEINIISDSTILNRGGWTQATYVDNMGSSVMAATGGGTTYYTGPKTYAALDNYPMTKKFNGDKDLVLHWFPNGDEIYLQDYSAISVATASAPDLSGFIVVLQAPSTNSVTYNFDLRVGLEYVPTDLIRNTAGVKVLPNVHPLAEYYMNMLVAEKWDPLVISDLEAWKATMLGTSLVREPLETRNRYANVNAGNRVNYTHAVQSQNKPAYFASNW
jgi:hypothetical protein